MHRFRDRQAAGRELADALRDEAPERPVVLGLPRGGVPVAYEIARALDAELDVWVVRKVGVPWQPELGMGAVAEGDHVHLSQQIVEQTGLSDDEIAEAVAAKRREVEERVARFRGDHGPPELRGRTVVLVDDGIATGGTVRAAIRSVRAQHPRRVVLAVPVCSPEAVEALEPHVDRLVALQTPPDLMAIGLWYEDFDQVPDEEVVRLLALARAERSGAGQRDAPRR